MQPHIISHGSTLYVTIGHNVEEWLKEKLKRLVFLLDALFEAL
jgi:hypothetical protein